ncbi:MAG: dephospho-CoA kinase, partial [Gallionella sp.]
MSGVRQPLTIGLTGGIGSGKSTVAELFRQHGARIIDTDVIAHQLTQACGLALPALQQQFGMGYLLSDGSLNRPAMRELIFNQPAAKQQLEAILHPLILQAVHTQLAVASNAPYTLLVVPLLLQSPAFLGLVQRILVIDCSEEQQIQRVMQRNQLSCNSIKQIIAQQTSRAMQLAQADELIRNDGDLIALAAQVAALDKIYTE